MGVLLQGNFRRKADAPMSKKQLSQHPAIKRSTRWVEQQVKAGMPSHVEGGKRMFVLPDVLEWLNENGRKVASG